MNESFDIILVLPFIPMSIESNPQVGETEKPADAQSESDAIGVEMKGTEEKARRVIIDGEAKREAVKNARRRRRGGFFAGGKSNVL